MEMSRTYFLPSREVDKKPVTRPSALERQWSLRQLETDV